MCENGKILYNIQFNQTILRRYVSQLKLALCCRCLKLKNFRKPRAQQQSSEWTLTLLLLFLVHKKDQLLQVQPFKLVYSGKGFLPKRKGLRKNVHKQGLLQRKTLLLLVSFHCILLCSAIVDRKKFALQNGKASSELLTSEYFMPSCDCQNKHFKSEFFLQNSLYSDCFSLAYLSTGQLKLFYIV